MRVILLRYSPSTQPFIQHLKLREASEKSEVFFYMKYWYEAFEYRGNILIIRRKKYFEYGRDTFLDINGEFKRWDNHNTLEQSFVTLREALSVLNKKHYFYKTSGKTKILVGRQKEDFRGRFIVKEKPNDS